MLTLHGNELSINCKNDVVFDNTNTIGKIYDGVGMEFHENISSNKIACDSTSEISINPNKCSIFRFKFREDFMIELSNFSKIHQYDSRKDFKESWKIWVQDNEELVNEEIRYLVNIGYNGDINDKMFKSARYYFRKKGTEKKEPKQRRDYVNISKKVLDSMDEHIRQNLDNDDILKPSIGFERYCLNNIEILKEEIKELCATGLTDSNEIQNKFKKTYKNRYFINSNNQKISK